MVSNYKKKLGERVRKRLKCLKLSESYMINFNTIETLAYVKGFLFNRAKKYNKLYNL